MSTSKQNIKKKPFILRKVTKSPATKTKDSLTTAVVTSRRVKLMTDIQNPERDSMFLCVNVNNNFVQFTLENHRQIAMYL